MGLPLRFLILLNRLDSRQRSKPEVEYVGEFNKGVVFTSTYELAWIRC